MENSDGPIARVRIHMIALGLGLGLLYWLGEAVLDVYAFHMGTMLQQIFRPHPHELWMRLFVILMLLSIGLYGRAVIAMRERASQMSRDILEKSPFGIYVVNDKGDIKYVNPAMITISGDTYEQFRRINVFQLETYKTIGLDEKIRRALRGESFFLGPVSYTSYFSKKTTMRNITGMPLEEWGERKVLMFVEDITGLMRAEEELRKLSRAVEQSPSTVLITDTKGDIEYVNPKFTQLTGYVPEEVIGKNPRILKSGEMSRESYAELWNTILSGGEWRGEFHNKRKNGELYWEFASISSIRSRDGTVEHYLRVAEDITQRKQIERLKDEFVSTVSHELRTPLTTIKEGVSQVLEGILGPISESQREFLTIVLSDIDRLARIITNLLDISKIEAGRFEIMREVVDIVELAKEVRALFFSYAKRKGLEILMNAPQGPIELYADRDKIIQVFANLVDNAIKFTERGQVEISIVDGPEEVECSVADTGVGISEDDLPKIFSKFYQIGRVAGPGEKGTGLGLSITKGIIESHNGKISVESKAQEGTRFTFVLPKGPVKEG